MVIWWVGWLQVSVCLGVCYGLSLFNVCCAVAGVCLLVAYLLMGVCGLLLSCGLFVLFVGFVLGCVWFCLVFNSVVLVSCVLLLISLWFYGCFFVVCLDLLLCVVLVALALCLVCGFSYSCFA